MTDTSAQSGSEDVRSVLTGLASGRELTETTAESVFERLMIGELEDAQIGALLALISARGPTVDELVGAARVMRRHVTPVPYDCADDESLIDTCGTGGAPKTFNVSTAAAIVAAAATPDAGSGLRRIVVAKHGNRSRTGRGSAEVLGALGVNVDADAQAQARCLECAGVCFCFAIHHHPAMRYAAGPRKALGFPTIFNLLGPLTNPARATRQLIGVARPEQVALVASALSRLGATRAMTAHSRNGLDEITTTDIVDTALVEGASITHDSIDPASLGLAPATIEQIRIDGVEASAELIREILRGEPGPASDTVCLTAGAALLVAGAAPTIEQGLTLAREALGSGAAHATLDLLVRASND